MSWQAELLGIDMRKLQTESPTNLKQLGLRRASTIKGENYWLSKEGKVPKFENWVSVAVAAKHFAYSEASFYSWLRQNLLKAKKENNQWLIDFKDLEKFLEDRKNSR